MPLVGEAVDGADRDVDRLVLVHGLDVGADRDLGGAAHHHPVLGAMLVLLQRQRAARLHHDALDLEALAGVDRSRNSPTAGARGGDRSPPAAARP